MRGKEAAFPARGGTAGAITPQHGFRPAVSPPVVWCGAVAGLHPRGSWATACLRAAETVLNQQPLHSLKIGALL